MKNLAMIGMMSLVLLALSCKKANEQEGGISEYSFRATVESHSDDSKTHIEDATKVKWNAGDKIRVCSSTCTAGKIFTTTGQETGGKVSFNAVGELPDNFFNPPYTAYYPAYDDGVIPGENVVYFSISDNKLHLPATQTYAANSFASGVNPMIATSQSMDLTFKHVCGLLKLQLCSSGYNVQSITLTSNTSTDKLWGTGEISDDPASLSVSSLASGGGNGTLTLNCEGVTLSATPTTFYFVVPVDAFANGFTLQVTDADGTVWSKGTSKTTNTINRGKVRAMPELQVVKGALSGLFSVGTSSKGTSYVYFSKGNLQYQASNGGTWRFAPNQYEYIGNAAGNTTPYTTNGSTNGRETQDDWIDQFAWGTSGFDNFNQGLKDPYYQHYHPYDIGHEFGHYPSVTDQHYSNYYHYGPSGTRPGTSGAFTYPSLSVGDNSDWGANAIENGGNQPKAWCTLSYDEWYYLINTRTNASSLKGLATVNGNNGAVLLPDDWTLPAGLTFTTTTTDGWSSNVYDVTKWSKMEAAGAVFFPAAGHSYLESSTIKFSEIGNNGYYQCSSPYTNSELVRFFSFSTNAIKMDAGCSRAYALSVRLVMKK